MELDLLLEGLKTSRINSPVKITGISADPRLCKPGFLYVAARSETVDSSRYGVYLDGRDFIDTAIEAGAAAILTDSAPAQSVKHAAKATFVYHEQPLSIFGTICARFFGNSRPEKIALVTGTNGKTSTVNFSRMLWQESGHPSCSVGNLGGVCSDGSLVWERDKTLSVPETVTLHKMLRHLYERGINHVAMEATSHALHDYRLHGVPACIGAFSNLTRDHLDFHDGMEDYFSQKMKLFTEVMTPGGNAVINADAEYYQRVRDICKRRNHRIISYGKNGDDIRLIQSSETENGQKIKLEVFGKSYTVPFNLFGQFQLSNALCALGIVIASGVPSDKAVYFLEKLTPVEGRLNIIARTPAGGQVVIDFAHTPDGLRAALEACRSFTRGKLYVVFGCNGDRDKGKRPEMAHEAAALADEVIVTDGLPRSEDPASIRKEVMSGAPAAKEIAARPQAIDFAIRALKSGDTVLIAGTLDAEQINYTDRATALGVVEELSRESHRSEAQASS